MPRLHRTQSLAGVPCEEGRAGWLPYGSTAPNVLIQHSLTSVPPAVELG